MAVEHLSDEPIRTLEVDELYWTNGEPYNLDPEPIGVTQLSGWLQPVDTDRDSAPELRYIADRLGRINKSGWGVHTPHEVNTRLGTDNEGALLHLMSEFELRARRINRMTQYVMENPLYVALTDFGDGTRLFDFRRYAARIQSFLLEQQGTGFIIEPIVEGPHGAVGRLPHILMHAQPYVFSSSYEKIDSPEISSGKNPSFGSKPASHL